MAGAPVGQVPNSAAAALNTARAEPLVLTPADAFSPDIDRELEEWKRTRGVRIPWRQISLIASLSFGIAWFVLPDTVSDPVSWLLLALSGASFVNGVAPRGKNYLAGAGGAGGGATNDPAGPGNSTGLS
jgi:hypothetical protein